MMKLLDSMVAFFLLIPSIRGRDLYESFVSIRSLSEYDKFLSIDDQNGFYLHLQYLLSSYPTIIFGKLLSFYLNKTDCFVEIKVSCVISGDKKEVEMFECDSAILHSFPPRHHLVLFVNNGKISNVFPAEFVRPIIFSQCNIVEKYSERTKEQCYVLERKIADGRPCWKDSPCKIDQSLGKTSMTSEINCLVFTLLIMFVFIKSAIFSLRLSRRKMKFYY